MIAPAIELRGVGKRFRLPTAAGATSLKTAVVDVLRRRRLQADSFAALDDIGLTVAPGRTVGIIGRNGSGKSTLLKLIAGIYRPDAGTIRVQGRVSSLIELGVGFHPEFTGRENILVNGMLLGLSRREVLDRFHDIITFAELAEFIDAPVRTYSSGMYVRLAFAIAVHVDPDVLLVDEVMAVGDEGFQTRCHERIGELRRRGKTLLVVTHDPALVERWCDEAIWLDQGRVRAIGPPRKILDDYHREVKRPELTESTSPVVDAAPAAPAPTTGQRWGTREIEIVDVTLARAGSGRGAVFTADDPLTITLAYRVNQRVSDVVFGFAIHRSDGLCVYGSNTALIDLPIPDLGDAGEVSVDIQRLGLMPGEYVVDVATHAAAGRLYDYHSRRCQFSVRGTTGELGIVRMPHAWRFVPLGVVSRSAR